MPPRVTSKPPDDQSTLPEDTNAKMNLGTYCSIKKLHRGYETRLTIYLEESHDPQSEKSFTEWEEIYNKAMCRVT
jgi:hypothetical protein